MARVVELKHSKKHYINSGNLAILLHRLRGTGQLVVSEAEVNAAYAAAIEAINGSTVLDKQGKKDYEKQFRSKFGK